MSARITQVDDLRLVAQPSAVPCTELFVRLLLSDWSLLPMVEQVTATTSRLVGDVVDQSRPASPAFVTVRLQLRGDVLVVEVEDDLPDPRPPRPAPGERMGVEPRGAAGRTTWCELPLPGGLSAGQVRLPAARSGAPWWTSRSPAPRWRPIPRCWNACSTGSAAGPADSVYCGHSAQLLISSAARSATASTVALT